MRARVYIILSSPVHPVWFSRPVRLHIARDDVAVYVIRIRDTRKLHRTEIWIFFSHSRIVMIYIAGRYVSGSGTTTSERQLLHNVWRKKENYPCEIAMIKTLKLRCIFYIKHPACYSYNITANGNTADVLKIMHANNIRNLYVSL